MNKKKILWILLTCIAVTVMSLPASTVQAQTYDFSSLYIQIDAPDGTIVLTKETPNNDEQWAIAGISDPKTEKKNFDNMGVQAIFYDQDSKSTVRLLKKDSSKSKSIFHLSQLSEKELNEFYETMTDTNDDSTSVTIQSYELSETLFFRYEIITNTGMTEVVYGTILNGSMISFDSYTQKSTEVINEDYLQYLVNKTHITRMFDKAEVQKSETISTLVMIGIIALIIIVITLIVLRNKRKNKKLALLRNQKAEKMSAFFKEQHEKEKQNMKDPCLFTNSTLYTEEVIKQFTLYNLFLHQLKVWIFTGLIFVLLLLTRPKNSAILFGIGFILLIVFIYIQSVQIEKSVKRTMNIYGSKKIEVNFQFYEDYFSVKENNSTIKYPYLQLTDVREYKGYIYLYRSTDQAFYLNKEKFEDFNGFKVFIDQKLIPFLRE